MPHLPILPKEPEAVSRRRFLRGCASCAAAVCARPACSATAAAPEGDKPKVRLVFTHPDPKLEGWPYQGFDFEGRKKVLTEKLVKALPGVSFEPVTVMKAEETSGLLESDSGVDGYVCYLLGIPSPRAAAKIMEAGRRVVLVDDLYGGTGEFLPVYSAAKRKGYKVAGVSSTRFEDVVQAVKTYETIRKLKSSTILDVCDRAGRADARAIEENFGTRIRPVASEEINEAYRKADQAEARKWAAVWIKNAKKIVEPTREEIGKSGVMYVAMRDLMQAHKAQALDIDCLTLFYGKKLPAYPCLGLFQFNDDGLVGACEADLQSTITMLMMGYLTGRPGFISDPVVDTSKNQIIYAHCVAPTKVYGPDGKAAPYYIRDHSEDRKGAVVQSFLPLGEITTTIKIHPVRREIVFHQGKTVANIDEDKACRTKLAAEVKDIDKLLGEWDRWGWHRVTFYGDLRRPVEHFAALTGMPVIVEG